MWTVLPAVLWKTDIWQKCFSNRNLLLFAQVPTWTGDGNGLYSDSLCEN